MASELDTIEGAAGVAVAGMLARRTELTGKRVAVVICGGNIAEDKLAGIHSAEEIEL
jgi:threonine dehydratase